MRDYTKIDSYLSKLAGDIYPQPEGKDLHPVLSKKVIDHWMSRLTNCNSVLDVGCGEAFCQPMFESWGVNYYEGVCLGEDYVVAREKGRNVSRQDFSFLLHNDASFDLIFSRHSLEHSPMPLLTLMEWHRVSKQWLGLVVPAIEWYGASGRNHYYVLHPDQWRNLLDNAGWKPIWDEVDELPVEPESIHVRPHEYWFFCERVK